MTGVLRLAMPGILCLTAATVASSQEGPFRTELNTGHFVIGIENGRLTGPGAERLRTAIAEARYVLLGEDHGIQQIPQFAGALCTELAPRGFHHLTIETGMFVAPKLEELARDPDGARSLAALEKAYPETIAVYSWKEEFAFLQQCESSAASAGMTLWGVDQEFLGSPAYLLEQILASRPASEARAAVTALLKELHGDHAAAVKSGSPADDFMLKVKQEDLDRVHTLLMAQGPPEARALFDSILVSREIYQKNLRGDAYASNRQRALLMKDNFMKQLAKEVERSGSTPKIFFKFGAWHMYRGLNPMHSSELGNLIGEKAEGQAERSVHILVLGVKGEQSRFSGIGRPFQTVPVDLVAGADSEFRFLKPFVDNHPGHDSWSLYDLRVLRDHFDRYGPIDPGLERVIFGFDFLVLIPDPKASHTLGETVTAGLPLRPRSAPGSHGAAWCRGSNSLSLGEPKPHAR